MKLAMLACTAWVSNAAAESEPPYELALSIAALSEARVENSASGAAVTELRGDASAERILGSSVGYRAAIGVGGELRLGAGDVPRTSSSVIARAAFADVPLLDGGPHIGLAATEIEHRRDLDRLPSLSDPRALLRLPYDRTHTLLDLTFIRARWPETRWSHAWVAARFDIVQDRQRDGDVVHTRDALVLEIDAMRYCRAPDHDPFCVRIARIENATGPGAMFAAHFAPVALSGLRIGAVRADIAIGLVGGRYDLPRDPDVDPPHHGGCDDYGTCVVLRTVGYSLALYDPPKSGALRIARRAYPTILRELAIEDRLSARRALAMRRFTIDAEAYTAHTQWWGLDGRQIVRLGSGVTGGVDMRVAREIGHWQIEGTVGAGRSWYGATDGDAPRAGLAAQGTLALRHEWRAR